MTKLIILHGWGHNKSMWRPMVEMLSGIVECEAVDLPGFGEEPLVDPNWNISDYAKWVEERIESEDRKIAILGHSFGGKVASQLASSKPSWLSALILFSAPSIYRPSIHVRLKIFMNKVLRAVIPYPLRMKLLHNNALVAADKNGLGQIFRNVVANDQTDRLGKISVPTYILWGTRDEVVPMRIAVEMNNLIPKSKLITIPDCGHNFFIDNPQIFYGTIKRIIKEVV